MFPIKWHAYLNHLWVLQTFIAVFWCVQHKRWVPMKGGSYVPWAAKQFRGLLVLHGAFYAVELYTTNMWAGFTPMAIHHSVAITIFTTIFLEPNSLSITTLTPFAIHTVYWALGATNFTMLYVYNGLLLDA
ncbi:hypothetical protein BC829DRAFT_223134 [Chytridium lagenaria]|nr:hypothetical protein BC829DRAFT_223134 [Chytridium lagenaria]